ncbi:MAG: hypothetical protein AAFX87_24540 [Bacteroidota bacterium]
MKDEQRKVKHSTQWGDEGFIASMLASADEHEQDARRIEKLVHSITLLGSTLNEMEMQISQLHSFYTVNAMLCSNNPMMHGQFVERLQWVEEVAGLAKKLKQHFHKPE